MHLRDRREPCGTVAIPPRDRVSDASRNTVIAVPCEANARLREETTTLRGQLEVVHGEPAMRG